MQQDYISNKGLLIRWHQGKVVIKDLGCNRLRHKGFICDVLRDNLNLSASSDFICNF